LKDLLSLVSKPVRYLGREVNSIRKDPSQIKLKFCLAFPDAYEVGCLTSASRSSITS